MRINAFELPMIPESKEAAAGLMVLPIRQLHHDPSNARGLRGVEELADSIRASGLLQPLGVYQTEEDKAEGTWTVESGNRRLAACRMAGLDEVPCICCMRGKPIGEQRQEWEHVVRAVATNQFREATDGELMLEIKRTTEAVQGLRADGVQKIGSIDIAAGKTRRVVAQLLGIPESRVATLSAIANNLAPELQEKFRAGELGRSVAYTLSQKPEEEQRTIAESDQPLKIADVKQTAKAEKKPQGKGCKEIKRENVLPRGMAYHGGEWRDGSVEVPADCDAVLGLVWGKSNNITLQGAYCLCNYYDDDGWFTEEYPEFENPEVRYWTNLPMMPEGCL